MSDPQPQAIRIAIVGTGNVGSTFAYALLLSGLAAEIVLIDANRAKAEGEAMDLQHTVPFAHPTRVWAGDYSDCGAALVSVIAAGVNQKPGETRIALLKRNAAVFAVRGAGGGSPQSRAAFWSSPLIPWTCSPTFH